MRIDPPPQTDDLSVLNDWLYRFWEKTNEDHLYGSDTWDPGNITANGDEHKDVTVTGAELGDHALASFSLDITDDLTISAEVSGADTVTVHLENHGVGAVDLASGTVYVRVFRKVS